MVLSQQELDTKIAHFITRKAMEFPEIFIDENEPAKSRVAKKQRHAYV